MWKEVKFSSRVPANWYQNSSMSLKDLVSKGLSQWWTTLCSHACVWFPGILNSWWTHVPGSPVLDFLPSPPLPTESNTQPHILRLNNILKTTLEKKAVYGREHKSPLLLHASLLLKSQFHTQINLSAKQK